MRFDPTKLLHCTYVESKMFDDRIYWHLSALAPRNTAHKRQPTHPTQPCLQSCLGVWTLIAAHHLDASPAPHLGRKIHIPRLQHRPTAMRFYCDVVIPLSGCMVMLRRNGRSDKECKSSLKKVTVTRLRCCGVVFLFWGSSFHQC